MYRFVRAALGLALMSLVLIAACDKKNETLTPSTEDNECVLTLVTPNGGEVLEANSESSIQWLANTCDSLVRIDLVLAKYRSSTIADTTLNDGEYTWIPEVLDGIESGYELMITGLSSGSFDGSDGPFDISFSAPDTPFISVISPNGGEAWPEGSLQDIHWISENCDSLVRIELMHNSEPVETLAESVENNGHFGWLPAAWNGEQGGYAIRVSDVGGKASDTSDATFSITPPIDDEPDNCQIYLVAPDGGETWIAGESYLIAWLSNGCDSRFRIELLLDDAVRAVLADSLENDGGFEWTAQPFDGSESGYKVRITALDSETSVESEASFSIITPSECALIVGSPNGGETWTEGQNRPIGWISNHCDSLVRVELLHNGEPAAVIAENTENDGSVIWQAERFEGHESGYQVRVTGIGSGVQDESDGEFEILAAPLCAVTVSSPNGGEVWTEGQNRVISWQSSHCGASVRIELLRGGDVVRTISASTANDGSYSWSAAQYQDHSDDYRVRITDLESGESDDSDGSFTILPQAVCAISMESPNGGESWPEGSQHVISWEASDCGGSVKLELLRNGVIVELISGSTGNDGSYTWTAQQSEGEVEGYKIRVTDLTSGTHDESDTSFEITDVPAGPDDYYCVKTTGTKHSGPSTTDIETFQWADADCYGSISEAMSEMSPGDQVWIDDGTYHDPVYFRPEHAGSADNYTIVRARNDGKVTLDCPDDYATLRIRETSYVEAVGFRIVDCGDFPIYVHQASHHFKIRRVGWNKRTGLVTGDSHHGLLEECYAYGGPHRYAMQTSKGAYKIIFRRCVVRWDYSNTQEPQACFANYSCEDIYYQNCISLDGTDNKGQNAPYDGLKSFFTPNGGFNTNYVGCISLNMDGAAGWYLEGPPGEAYLSDCVIWDHRTNAADATDAYRAFPFTSTADEGGLVANRLTIGISDIGDRPVRFDPGNHENLRNSIIFGMELDSGNYAIEGELDEHDFNCFFGNTGDRNCSEGTGPHSLEDLDPLSNGLYILTEIDPGSELKTAGENNGQIGAQITNRIGVSGTLYGESGWDMDTGEPLWPFPYEDQIREDCRNFYMNSGAAYGGSPLMDGERGFCAPGQTLSTYIRGYLQSH